MAEITLVQAVNLALARAMADDPSVLVVGEDVGELPVLPPGGPRGGADDPVRLGRGPAFRLQQPRHPAGGRREKKDPGSDAGV